MKQLINRYLRKFGVELHGLGFLQSLAKGEFKTDAFAIQKDLFNGRTVSTIFDAGANCGEVAKNYLDVFPSSSIYAFEPFPETYSLLQDRFRGTESVHCSPCALGDKVGSDRLYVNKNVDTNSLLKPIRSGLSTDAEVENRSIIDVQVTTLDSFCREKGINSIDILKMDIQGGEYAALQGATGLLGSRSIGIIYSEVFFVEQYEKQPLFHNISTLLHSFGYYLKDIYAPIYGNGNLAWADVIFVKAK